MLSRGVKMEVEFAQFNRMMGQFFDGVTRKLNDLDARIILLRQKLCVPKLRDVRGKVTAFNHNREILVVEKRQHREMQIVFERMDLEYIRERQEEAISSLCDLIRIIDEVEEDSLGIGKKVLDMRVREEKMQMVKNQLRIMKSLKSPFIDEVVNYYDRIGVLLRHLEKGLRIGVLLHEIEGRSIEMSRVPSLVKGQLEPFSELAPQDGSMERVARKLYEKACTIDSDELRRHNEQIFYFYSLVKKITAGSSGTCHLSPLFEKEFHGLISFYSFDGAFYERIALALEISQTSHQDLGGELREILKSVLSGIRFNHDAEVVVRDEDRAVFDKLLNEDGLILSRKSQLYNILLNECAWVEQKDPSSRERFHSMVSSLLCYRRCLETVVVLDKDLSDLSREYSEVLLSYQGEVSKLSEETKQQLTRYMRLARTTLNPALSRIIFTEKPRYPLGQLFSKGTDDGYKPLETGTGSSDGVKNPLTLTGVKGKGVLPSLGPNEVDICVVQSPEGDVLLGKPSKMSDYYFLPQRGDSDVLRSSISDLISGQLNLEHVGLSSGESGVEDDPRNTDDAWVVGQLYVKQLSRLEMHMLQIVGLPYMFISIEDIEERIRDNTMSLWGSDIECIRRVCKRRMQRTVDG